MGLIDQIRDQARALNQHIVLPEGTEKRTIAAAAILTKEKIAHITLLGPAADINAVAKENNVDLSGVDIIEPENSDLFSGFAEEFCRLREKKGMTMDKAIETMKNPLYFGVMMVHTGLCHGMVAGAENATGDVLRPALQIIKTKPGVSLVSGAFVMISPKKELGEDGVMIFADCAVNPTLTAEQMAEVAFSCSETARDIAGIKDPRVAMLSFSTKGSAKHDLVSKVQEATALAKQKFPQLKIDGELQMDAAIVPSVGEFKSPGSEVAGHANVLVFPDLQSGNICYKAAQYFGDVISLGPILQGIGKPVNDLSRGCSIDDIVNTVAIVCCQN